MDCGIFSPRSSLNTDCCVVNGCRSKAHKNTSLRFHRFPKPNERVVYVENIFGKSEKVDRLKAWEIALKVQVVTPRMKVCSYVYTVIYIIIMIFLSRCCVTKKVLEE